MDLTSAIFLPSGVLVGRAYPASTKWPLTSSDSVETHNGGPRGVAADNSARFCYIATHQLHWWQTSRPLHRRIPRHPGHHHHPRHRRQRPATTQTARDAYHRPIFGTPAKTSRHRHRRHARAGAPSANRGGRRCASAPMPRADEPRPTTATARVNSRRF